MKALILILITVTLGVCNLPNIAVNELKVMGLSKDEAFLITDRLRTEIVKTGKYEVMERAEMDMIVKEMEFQQSGMCDESECLVQLGEVLGVQKMISGTVGKIGNLYTISIRVIDVQTTLIEKSVAVDNPKGLENFFSNSLQDVALQITGGGTSVRSDNERRSINSTSSSSSGSSTYNSTSTGSSSSKTATQTTAKQWFSKGYEVINKRTKIEYYTKAVQLDPNYEEAFYNRGIAYYDLKEYDNAIADYTVAISLKSDYSSAWYNRSLCYYNKKQYQKALFDAQKAISFEKGSANFFLNRANIYYVLTEYRKAISDYTQSLSLGVSTKVSAYRYRAKSYKKLKEYHNAIIDYDYVIAQSSRKANDYFERGYCYGENGNKYQAISDYNRALELDSKHKSSFYNRGTVYYDQKKYRKAENDFKRTLDIDPGYSFAYYYLGLIYESDGKTSDAIYQFNRYIRSENRSSSRDWINKAQNRVRNLGGTPASSTL